MRKVLIIAGTALTRLARDRKALITLLLMPMVLIGILGSALGSMLEGGGIHPYTVIIVNADQPAKPAVPEGTPQQVRDALPTMDLGKILATEVLTSDQIKEIITLKTETDLDKAKDAVAKGQAAAAVHVPADFTANVINSKAANIDVYSDPGMATQAEIVQQIVRSFTEQVTTGNMVSRLLGPDKAQQAILELTDRLPVVKEASSGTRQVKAIQYYAAAMAIMFMVSTAFNRAKDILEEQADGTLARILVSPTGKAQVICGQILGTMAVILSQFVILMIGTRLLFQVDWGDWAAALALGASFSLAAAGIGTAAAALLNNPRAADSATGVVGMIFAALSGSMFPLYLFPDGLKMVARFIPNYWALQGFLDQMSGLGLSYLWMPVAILCAIGLVTGSVGAWRLASK